SKIFFWMSCIVNRNQVRSLFKAVNDSSEGGRKRTAAMSKCNTKFWKSLEHTAENQRTDCARSFSRHSHQPRQPIFLHLISSHHLPWMNENARAEFFCLLKKWKELRLTQIFLIHVRTDFYSGKF